MKIRIHHPYPTNGRPAATVLIPRRGQQDVEITIESGATKYDTIKLIVKPSRAVNPPFGQYIGGIDQRLVHSKSGETKFVDVDDRVDVVKEWIASALEGIAGKGHVTAAQSQVKNMLKQLDKAKHHEPVTAANKERKAG